MASCGHGAWNASHRERVTPEQGLTLKGKASQRTWFTLLSCRPWDPVAAGLPLLARGARGARLPRKTSKGTVRSVTHGASPSILIRMEGAHPRHPSRELSPHPTPSGPLPPSLQKGPLHADPQELVTAERKDVCLPCQTGTPAINQLQF